MKQHYVYKITDPKTGQYYFGSRTNENPETDDYMGSMQTWEPEDKNRLIKEIIKDDFKTREEAIEFEAKLIEKYVDDSLNENYHIPNKGFHVTGLERNIQWRNRLSKSITKWIEETGHWNQGNTRPDSVKEKIRKKLTGRKLPKEQIEKQKISMKGRHSGSDNPFFGKTHTEEFKQLQSERSSGEKNYFYNVHLTGSSNPRATAVRCIKDGQVFDTIQQCAEYYGLNRSTVSNHCRGTYKTQKFEYCN